MKIAVIGTGYVGLTTGTCLAEMGNDVICIDTDEAKIRQLRGGVPTIYEPGLEEYLKRNIADGRLRFSQRIEDAAGDRELVFLALPTPSTASGSADLSIVLLVVEQLAQLLQAEQQHRYRILVNKSTVPVGTADRILRMLERSGIRLGTDLDVVSNPEFLREGTAVTDSLKPDRVVIGTYSERAANVMKDLYQPYVRQGHPIHVMEPRSAEMTKYAANAFLAGRITFMNEIANLCEAVGADVEQVRTGIGSDHRIGSHFLYAGLGFGGSCFPKDVRALIDLAHQHGHHMQMIDAILAINRRQRALLSSRIRKVFGGDLEKRRFAVWGLAFKPNTDDVREAPSHDIIRDVLAHGGTVTAFDPVAADNTRVVFGDRISYATSAMQAAEGVDALIICTEWHEFRHPDFHELKQTMRRPLVFDGRNLYSPEQMARLGFDYYSIGRAHVAPDPHEEIIPDVEIRTRMPVHVNGSA